MNVVYTIQQILLGQSIYNDPGAPPYAITQYTPLLYYVTAIPAAIASVPAGDVLAVSAIARAVSVTIAFALALTCAVFIRRRIGANTTVTFVAAVFIMCSAGNWYFAVRPDGLATLLTLISFYIVTRERLDKTSLAAAAFFAVAAIFAKQTGIFAVITIVAFLGLRRQWEDLAFAGGMMLVAMIVGLGIMPLTGHAIRANIIDGINNGIAWRPALMLAYRPAYYWLAPLVALAFAAFPQLIRESESPPSQLIGLAIAISFPMSMLAALKRGSAENYFNELLILCVFAVVAAYIVRAVRGELRVDRVIANALFVYLSAFLLIRAGHQVYITYLYHRVSPETRLTSQIPPVDYVRRNIAPGRYAIGFGVGLSNAFPERMIVPEKVLADAAQQRRLVHYSKFAEDMRTGRIQYAIARNGESLQPFLGARFDRFRPVRRFRYYTVYKLD